MKLGQFVQNYIRNILVKNFSKFVAMVTIVTKTFRVGQYQKNFGHSKNLNLSKINKYVKGHYISFKQNL